MNEIQFKKACGQANGALYNFQAWLEREHSLTGTEAALVSVLILESLPKTFTPHGLQAYIDSVREKGTGA